MRRDDCKPAATATIATTTRRQRIRAIRDSLEIEERGIFSGRCEVFRSEAGSGVTFPRACVGTIRASFVIGRRMTRLLIIVLVVHGLIHLLGFVKGFRLAELPQLTQPISALFGLVWLAASVLFIATAVSVLVWPRWWWALGAIAVCVSMVAISSSWADARVGALANLVILAGVVVGFMTR